MCVTDSLSGKFLHFILLLYNAGINFIQNHPPSWEQTPRTRLEAAKTLPQDNPCVQKPSPRDQTGSQKPYPLEINSENFRNVSINSDTI